MNSSPIPDRPILLGLYHAIRLSDKQVQISNSGRSVVVSGEGGFADRVVSLLESLDGVSTVAHLQGQFPDLVPGMLESLAAKGLLAEGSDVADPALTTMVAALAGGVAGPQALSRLSKATVGFSGCGPAAVSAAMAMAKAGVGRILLVDPRPLAATDSLALPLVQGQILGGLVNKAEAALKICGGGTMTEVAEAPISSWPHEKVDLGLIEMGYAVDSVSRDADACLQAGIPHIVHAQDGLEAVIGPLVSGQGDPCHRCLDARRLSNIERLGEHMAYRRHRAGSSPGPDAFSAAHTWIVGGLLATEALRSLIGCAAPHGEATLVDLATLNVHREEILPVPNCPGCRSAPWQK